VDESEQWFGLSWADGKAHTIGGQIMERLGRVPKSGEKLMVHGMQLEVERVRRNAVETVLVTPFGWDKAGGDEREPTDV
jgi:CBS domain containing-hemolysin-like protein